MRASRDVAKVSRHEAWRILGVLAVVFVLTSPDVARAETNPPAGPTVKTAGAPPAAAAKSTPAVAVAKSTVATPAPTKSAPAPVKTTPAPAKSAPAMAQAAPVGHPAKPGPGKTTTNSATGSTAAARPVAEAPNDAGGARPTPNDPVAARASTIVPARNPKAPGTQSAPSIEEQVTYQYNALGRRDPFQAMIGGPFVGEDVGGDAPFDVGGMKVVGIVWGASDKFALVEDARGQSSVLRAGDKVMNGVVETLKRDAVVVNLTVDGQTESVTIPLTRKGDQTNGNR